MMTNGGNSIYDIFVLIIVAIVGVGVVGIDGASRLRILLLPSFPRKVFASRTIRFLLIESQLI